MSVERPTREHSSDGLPRKRPVRPGFVVPGLIRTVRRGTERADPLPDPSVKDVADFDLRSYRMVRAVPSTVSLITGLSLRADTNNSQYDLVLLAISIRSIQRLS